MTDNENILTPSKIIKFLDYAYEKSIDGIGIPGIDTAHSLAESYLKTGSSLKEQINSLIRWQNTKSATSGFLTGLGGIITLSNYTDQYFKCPFHSGQDGCIYCDHVWPGYS
ncbi:TPA: hypothetical protein ACH9XW_001232 [Escherichia coli]